MTATAVAVRERPILFSGEMVRAILAERKTQTRRVMKPQPPIRGEGTDRAPDGEVSLRPDAFPTGNTRGLVFCHQVARGHRRMMGTETFAREFCPYGVVGDQLWVRETWAARGTHTDRYAPAEIACNRSHFEIWYHEQCFNGSRAKFNTDFLGRWRPSIHMPRALSRLTLEITDVRVERLQSITTADARSEGCVASERESETDAYHNLWDSLNGSRGYSWDSSPWVWVLGFRKVTP